MPGYCADIQDTPLGQRINFLQSHTDLRVSMSSKILLCKGTCLYVCVMNFLIFNLFKENMIKHFVCIDVKLSLDLVFSYLDFRGFFCLKIIETPAWAFISERKLIVYEGK